MSDLKHINMRKVMLTLPADVQIAMHNDAGVKVCDQHSVPVWFIGECAYCLREHLNAMHKECTMLREKLNPPEFKPDASGAYINPGQLEPLAACFRGTVAHYAPTGMNIYEALRRASLEIARQRAELDAYAQRDM